MILIEELKPKKEVLLDDEFEEEEEDNNERGLKRLLKLLRNFFLGIFNFIDRVIVTPVTKFGLFLGEKTDKNAGKFEKWLNKKNTLVFISLFMALLFILLC